VFQSDERHLNGGQLVARVALNLLALQWPIVVRQWLSIEYSVSVSLPTQSNANSRQAETKVRGAPTSGTTAEHDIHFEFSSVLQARNDTLLGDHC
jgi:hypothetical protein